MCEGRRNFVEEKRGYVKSGGVPVKREGTASCKVGGKNHWDER